jgi:Cu-processing system permease protein
MSIAAAAPAPRPARLFAARLIAKTVLLELLRRKDFYVVLILMSLYFAGALAFSLIKVESAAAGTMLLNLSLTLAGLSAHLLTLAVAARQLPDEFERRTLLPLLAKPLSRGSLFFGKWLACAGCGVGVLLVLFLCAWLIAPKLESYSAILLAQTFILQAASVSLLAALALAFSLVFTRGVNMLSLGLLLIFSRQIFGFIQARAAVSSWRTAIEWLAAYCPNFSQLNLITRYTDGIGQLAPMEFLGLLGYAAIFIFGALVAGALLLERRAL